MTTFRAFLRLSLVLVPIASLSARPVAVVTSNTILADLVREVAGDRAQITCLARPGADLHDFEPRAADVKMLARADLVILNGLGLEPWIGKLVGNSGFRGRTVEACEGIQVIGEAGHFDHDDDGHEHAVDPHAWHDPACARIYVRNIRAALSEADPSGRSVYEAGETRFLEHLDRIDTWAREAFAAIPSGNRRIVTSHDSLAYLGRAFGLEFVSVTGISPTAEPSARQVARLIDTIRESGVRAVFIDSADNPALMRRIASDSGVGMGGRLYTDSLGEPGSGAETYLGMLEHNLRHILDSLR